MPVRYSEFHELVADVFGPQLGRVLVADQVLDGLAERTAAEALADGEDPRAVWTALCNAMEVPAALRWGTDRPRR